MCQQPTPIHSTQQTHPLRRYPRPMQRHMPRQRQHPMLHHTKVIEPNERIPQILRPVNRRRPRAVHHEHPLLARGHGHEVRAEADDAPLAPRAAEECQVALVCGHHHVAEALEIAIAATFQVCRAYTARGDPQNLRPLAQGVRPVELLALAPVGFINHARRSRRGLTRVLIVQPVLRIIRKRNAALAHVGVPQRMRGSEVVRRPRGAVEGGNGDGEPLVVDDGGLDDAEEAVGEVAGLLAGGGAGLKGGLGLGDADFVGG